MLMGDASSSLGSTLTGDVSVAVLVVTGFLSARWESQGHVPRKLNLFIDDVQLIQRCALNAGFPSRALPARHV